MYNIHVHSYRSELFELRHNLPLQIVLRGFSINTIYSVEKQ